MRVLFFYLVYCDRQKVKRQYIDTGTESRNDQGVKWRFRCDIGQAELFVHGAMIFTFLHPQQ